MPVSIMKQIIFPEYSEIGSILNQTALKLHPSQAHGLICGLLCGHSSTPVAWKELLTGETDVNKPYPVLEDLYDISARQLEEFLFEFNLVLPADSASLPERAEALTLWSQGFLTGLKFVQVQILERKPSETTEAINDIIEIAKMNYEEVIASEEDEAAYVELVEYVRMAVILIYQALGENDLPKKQIGSNYLH